MVLSFFTSMGGVTGAVLILPFQVSVLGFTSPSVNSTNLLYNIIGAPGGVYRYIKEGRMVWPLAWIICAGTLPGVFLGYYIRVKYLPRPESFKLFAGIVILYVGIRLVHDIIKKNNKPILTAAHVEDKKTKVLAFNIKEVQYEFGGEIVGFKTPSMFLLALIIGIVGGAYGIGGGAIIAPFCITMFNLPVYTVSGAAIFGTFATSILGVIFYTFVPLEGQVAPPDWLLGFSFGIGGFIGMYLGAKYQRYFPEKIIKAILAAIFMFISFNYIYQFVK